MIGEYKRLLHLAMRAVHAVTPSDQVDQAWHLQFTHTLSYWDDLCGKILNKRLRHAPIAGGAE